MKNVCVVGFGAIGKVHTEAIIKTEKGRLYGVCDNDSAKLDSAKEKYDIKTYQSFDEMLENDEIDSVHICTPHYLHYEMIEKALKKGKIVLCEKPVVMTAEELEKLKKLDTSRLYIVFQNRLNPCSVKLKEICDSGELGSLVSAKCILTWNRDMKYYNSGEWRGKLATEGGGVLINQAVHTLDFFSYVFGGVKSVRAKMTNFTLPEIEVEDTFCASLNLNCGAKGIFFATNGYGVNSFPDIEAVFEKGKVKYFDGILFSEGKILERDSGEYKGKTYWGNGHEHLIKNLYDFNEGFKLESALNTMETMFSMYESARNL